jgi:hypothetical protein
LTVSIGAAVASVLVVASVAAAAASGAGSGRSSGASCSAFGPSWARSYNARAIVTGNPVRILGACCQPTEKAGVNHCFVIVTLAGTVDRGCELVDIGPSGLPAGPGKHERCKVRQQTA